MNAQVSPANQSTLTGTSVELRPLQTEHASELLAAVADGELWNMKANRKLEIGHTWLSSSVQRSGINTEAKLLLLTYAFEAMDAIRVQFTTDELNEKSRAAILRIGAKQEDSLVKQVIETAFSLLAILSVAFGDRFHLNR